MKAKYADALAIWVNETVASNLQFHHQLSSHNISDIDALIRFLLNA